MKKFLFTAIMLLMGMLSLSETSLSAASTLAKVDAPFLIEKDAALHHKKWFLRFSVQRPTLTLSTFPEIIIPLFGHFQVALRSPSGKRIYTQTFSMEQLSVDTPSIYTIKIDKNQLLKGQYTLFVTLLDRNSDSGVFDSNDSGGIGATESSYFPGPTTLFDNKNRSIILDPEVPLTNNILLPTDPSAAMETFFTLHLP